MNWSALKNSRVFLKDAFKNYKVSKDRFETRGLYMRLLIKFLKMKYIHIIRRMQCIIF